MLVYPFTTVLDIMKPSKIDKRNPAQVKQLKDCMHSPDYMWEEKLDGISILAIGGRLFSNKVSKKTGWPGEKTLHMPQVSQPLMKVSPYLVLDGEAYVPGYKSNDVTSITNSDIPVALSKQAERGNLQYHVYDILRDTDGTWINNWPFEKRRKKLEELFATLITGNEFSHIVLNPIHETAEDPEAALDEILSRGLEGIVLKHKQGTYQPGRRPMWVQVKMKASMEDDVVITGFEPATRKYTGKNLATWPYWENDEPVTSNYALGLIGSIRVGKYNTEGKLVDIGKVTGINETLRKDFTEHPDKYIGEVIKIKAMETTEDGKYRHANFLEFHPDKNPTECKLVEND
jgi:ATP-dependent DNA ligase